MLNRLISAAERVTKYLLKSRPMFQLHGLNFLLFWKTLSARKAEFRFSEIGRLLSSDKPRRNHKAREAELQRATRELESLDNRLSLFKKNGNQALLQYGLQYLEKTGHSFAALGKQAQAELCLSIIARYRLPNTLAGIDNLRNLAIIQFMLGYVGKARATFASMCLAQRQLQVRTRVKADYRFLGRSWFVAIGHVAMIDILLKQRELGWFGGVTRLVICEDVRNIAGKTILNAFLKLGVELAESQQIYYEFHRSSTEPRWDELTQEEREGLVAEFWTYSIPQSDGNFYAHGAACIQTEWDRQGRAPLLTLSKKERASLGILLEQLGIPPQAWYVCLHVRESGFHGKWNKTYPSARDASIDDYYPAMQAIADRGGWVIRMGDASMKALEPMPNVVDYVQTSYKAEPVDTLLASGCRFMLGTNSGFSILPATYGAPCVLTNWIPIALPNWYGIDLTIPKLMRSRSSGKLLDFATMLEDPIGAIQNPLDFSDDIEIIESSADEILQVTVEMLDRLDGAEYTPAEEAMQKRYFDLAISKGSYRGSRIGREFLAHHQHLLPVSGGMA